MRQFYGIILVHPAQMQAAVGNFSKAFNAEE
jgi:hypothetical protein